MENKIQAGDVVYLNSETQIKMTVGSHDGPNHVICYWFIGGELKWAKINISSITKVK